MYVAWTSCEFLITFDGLGLDMVFPVVLMLWVLFSGFVLLGFYGSLYCGGQGFPFGTCFRLRVCFCFVGDWELMGVLYFSLRVWFCRFVIAGAWGIPVFCFDCYTVEFVFVGNFAG